MSTIRQVGRDGGRQVDRRTKSEPHAGCVVLLLVVVCRVYSETLTQRCDGLVTRNKVPGPLRVLSVHTHEALIV